MILEGYGMTLKRLTADDVELIRVKLAADYADCADLTFAERAKELIFDLYRAAI